MSKINLLAKIVNSCKSVTVFAKYSFLDVWQGSEYASAGVFVFPGPQPWPWPQFLFPSPGHQLVFIGPATSPFPSVPICVYRPWSPIKVYRPDPNLYLWALTPTCVYQPWPKLCIYQPWSLNCIYQPWPRLLPPIFIYQSRSRFYWYYHSQ